MGNIQSIFGIRENNSSFSRPARQSIEQSEDYAVKKSIHTKELTVNGISITGSGGTGTKIYLDVASDTYFTYNSVSLTVELWVNGVKVAEW